MNCKYSGVLQVESKKCFLTDLLRSAKIFDLPRCMVAFVVSIMD